MQREMLVQPANRAQGVGAFLTFLEALLFGFVAVLHFGVAPKIAEITFSAPPLLPAALVEGIVALALLISVLVPGEGRAGRVMAAQLLALVAMFAIHVALMRLGGFDARNEIFYAVALVLSLASIACVASPAFRRKSPAR